MKWKSTKFQYKDIAQLAYDELKAANIRVASDGVYQYENNYIVDWMPIGEEQLQIGIEIINRHIW